MIWDRKCLQTQWVSIVTVYRFQGRVNHVKPEHKWHIQRIYLKSVLGFLYFYHLQKCICATAIVQQQQQKNSLKIPSSFQGRFDCDCIVTSGCVVDEKVPELRWTRESCRWRLCASCFPPCTSIMGGGRQGVGVGGARGGVLRHCLTDSQGQRLSQRPGTTRSSSSSHHRTNNAALQLRLWPHSHPLQIPPPHPIYSTNPSWPAPPPRHGPGHRERWHAFLSLHPVQTRWLCSATVSNKSEHIYDAKRSGTLSFAALFHVRGLKQDKLTYFSRGQF